jgi:hypothetical protein
MPYSGHFPGKTEKNHENFSQNSLCPDLNSNQASPTDNSRAKPLYEPVR